MTIDCPERGLLLMKPRGSLKSTMAAYQALYQSSVGFGIRKQADWERSKPAAAADYTIRKEEGALDEKIDQADNVQERVDVQERVLQKKINQRMRRRRGLKRSSFWRIKQTTYQNS